MRKGGWVIVLAVMFTAVSKTLFRKGNDASCGSELRVRKSSIAQVFRSPGSHAARGQGMRSRRGLGPSVPSRDDRQRSFCAYLAAKGAGVKFRLPAACGWVLLICMAWSLQGRALAQVPTGENFDPSDVYFQGYLAIRAAEQFEKDGDDVGALNKYQQAMDLLGSVGKFYPDWKSDMVRNRLDLTGKALAGVRERASEKIKKDRGVIAELEGGERQAGKPIDSVPDDKTGGKGVLEVDPLKARRLKDMEAELARLKREISKAEAAGGQSTKNLAADDLQRQNTALKGQLQSVQKEVGALRAQLAAAPVEGVLKELTDRIERLNQEKEVMSLALKTSRGGHAEALSRIEILTADMELLKRSQADIKRDLELEREVANEVVAGQLRQLANMEKSLAEKDKQLSAANEQIAIMRRELDESRSAYAELQEERDGLLREREHMKALLKLSESGRIEELIEQNMGLAKDLREAKERMERMNLDHHAAKDEVVEAQRNLAIAKSQINRLHREKREQDQRIAELTEKLQNEEVLLTRGEAGASPEEVEILKEVIKRQLRVQERRRQAKDLLVEAVKSLGKEDQRIHEAIALFEGSELVLSPGEQRLVAEREVDGEFVSPSYARDPEVVGRETARLNVELESYNRAAAKAYLAGRLLSTRELFEMMIEQHPGHVPAICRLGVVHLKLNEPMEALASFQKAIELDKSNPYANRMLGFTYMQMDDLAMASQYLQKAIQLAPDDAKTYVLKGLVSYRLGDEKDAESQFKAAIVADPLPSEPYFNIAMICANQGRMDDAKEYYAKALERGAIPDLSLEAKITKS